MADKGIIDRIKKLLALAKGNTNAAEATAAALKAQKLIADHDVSKADLYEDEPDEITEVTNHNDINGQPWAKYLASAIADNFRCCLFYRASTVRSYYGRDRKTGEHIVFIGYETDAEAAKVTYDRLYEIGKRLADKECRKARMENGTARGVRNSFLLGYVKGIRTELEKQSTALVLVRPKAVDDYTEERTANFGFDRSRVRSAYAGNAYDNGQRAGRDSVRSARLKGQAALTA